MSLPLPIGSSDEMDIPDWSSPAVPADSPGREAEAPATAGAALLHAVQQHQRRLGREVLTWDEVLAVARLLGRGPP